MKLPRARFTIGGLMILILVAGVATWFGRVIVARQRQSAAERLALAAYRRAVLTREVAEYAVKEFDQGVAKQDRAGRPGPEAEARIAAGRRSLLGDVEKAKADEASKRAAHRAERRNRASWFGI